MSEHATFFNGISWVCPPTASLPAPNRSFVTCRLKLRKRHFELGAGGDRRNRRSRCNDRSMHGHCQCCVRGVRSTLLTADMFTSAPSGQRNRQRIRAGRYKTTKPVGVGIARGEEGSEKRWTLQFTTPEAQLFIAAVATTAECGLSHGRAAVCFAIPTSIARSALHCVPLEPCRSSWHLPPYPPIF